MELQFEKNVRRYLRTAAWEVQRQEQTQEVKLPDTMPDVGRVLGCWGQPVLRSKEWRGGGMNAAGGVMTWTLYAPEDGSEPRCIESWVPFQLKWDFPQTDREGTMNISCQLRSADARTVSARKLMVRVCVNGLGIAMDSAEAETYMPEHVPEDVKLLRGTYPVTLPTEAGEKNLQLDEELSLPGTFSGECRLIRYSLRDQLQEQKLIGDRLVFRGNVILHLLLMNGSGRLSGADLEVPFSQYVDLDRTHEGEAEAQIQLALTGMEAELDLEGRVRLKASFAAQYIIWERSILELVEDCYSTQRDVKLFEQVVTLPAMLEDRRETVSCEQTVPVECSQLADAAYLPDHPAVNREGDMITMTVPGNVQVLYYDAQGNLQGTTAQCENSWSMNADMDCKALAMVHCVGNPQVMPGGEGISLRCDGVLQIKTISGQGMGMVTGLDVGEVKEPDPNRPSLILRRAGSQSLWEMAKSSGSTVDAILQANGLEEEPAAGRMLLIPVQ